MEEELQAPDINKEASTPQPVVDPPTGDLLDRYSETENAIDVESVKRQQELSAITQRSDDVERIRANREPRTYKRPEEEIQTRVNLGDFGKTKDMSFVPRGKSIEEVFKASVDATIEKHKQKINYNAALAFNNSLSERAINLRENGEMVASRDLTEDEKRILNQELEKEYSKVYETVVSALVGGGGTAKSDTMFTGENGQYMIYSVESNSMIPLPEAIRFVQRSREYAPFFRSGELGVEMPKYKKDLLALSIIEAGAPLGGKRRFVFGGADIASYIEKSKEDGLFLNEADPDTPSIAAQVLGSFPSAFESTWSTIEVALGKNPRSHADGEVIQDEQGENLMVMDAPIPGQELPEDQAAFWKKDKEGRIVTDNTTAYINERQRRLSPSYELAFARSKSTALADMQREIARAYPKTYSYKGSVPDIMISGLGSATVFAAVATPAAVITGATGGAAAAPIGAAVAAGGLGALSNYGSSYQEVLESQDPAFQNLSDEEKLNKLYNFQLFYSALGATEGLPFGRLIRPFSRTGATEAVKNAVGKALANPSPKLKAAIDATTRSSEVLRNAAIRGNLTERVFQEAGQAVFATGEEVLQEVGVEAGRQLGLVGMGIDRDALDAKELFQAGLGAVLLPGMLSGAGSLYRNASFSKNRDKSKETLDSIRTIFDGMSEQERTTFLELIPDTDNLKKEELQAIVAGTQEDYEAFLMSAQIDPASRRHKTVEEQIEEGDLSADTPTPEVVPTPDTPPVAYTMSEREQLAINTLINQAREEKAKEDARRNDPQGYLAFQDIPYRQNNETVRNVTEAIVQDIYQNKPAETTFEQFVRDVVFPATNRSLAPTADDISNLLVIFSEIAQEQLDAIEAGHIVYPVQLALSQAAADYRKAMSKTRFQKIKQTGPTGFTGWKSTFKTELDRARWLNELVQRINTPVETGDAFEQMREGQSGFLRWGIELAGAGLDVNMSNIEQIIDLYDAMVSLDIDPEEPARIREAVEFIREEAPEPQRTMFAPRPDMPLFEQRVPPTSSPETTEQTEAQIKEETTEQATESEIVNEAEELSVSEFNDSYVAAFVTQRAEEGELTPPC